MSPAIAAAAEWLAAVQWGDAPRMWALVHPEYRLLIVERLITLVAAEPRFAELRERIGLDSLAKHLGAAEPGPDVSDWLEGIRSVLVAALPTQPDPGKLPTRSPWGWASRPRPIALDCELVLYVEHAPGRAEHTTVVPQVQFYMRLHEGEWLVGGIDEAPFLDRVSSPHL